MFRMTTLAVTLTVLATGIFGSLAMAAAYMPINDGCIVWTTTETD